MGRLPKRAVNRQIKLSVVFSFLWSIVMSYTGDLFCAFRLIVSAYFWRIYGPFIWPFMRVWSDAAQTSFNVTICGVQNIVFPSLYSNVKQDSNMKSHWWLVDSGAGRSMSSNVEDFIYLEPWTGGKVQVGSGEVMDVTHRGIIQLYARRPQVSTRVHSGNSWKRSFNSIQVIARSTLLRKTVWPSL